MSITFKLDGALLPFQSVRLNGGPGGVQGLPSSAWYGEPLTAGLTIEDPTGALDLVGWHTFTVDEPACTSAPRIFTGWITGRTIHRGVYRTGAGRVWDCDIIDQNALFSLEVFRASSARRPAETDLVRAQFAIDSAPMAGTPVAVTSRTNLTDNPRGFGDSDYVTQYPVDLFTSITATVGKNFYAYWDEGEQAIGLHYDLVGANPASTLRISNVITDVDSTTTFAPFIDATLERSPEDIYTGILFGYRGAYVYARRQATIDALSPSEFSPNQFRRDLVYRTDRVGLVATANALVQSMLEERSIEKDVIRVTVQLPASKVNLIHAGMALDLKFSHLPGYEDFETVAVVRRDVVPTDGHDELYNVNLECTNAAKAAGPGGGTGGEFPHQPEECNASVLQTAAGTSTGISVSAAFDETPTPGNVVWCGITLRGTGAIVTPTVDGDPMTQIETQGFDDDNQSHAVYYREVQVGDSATVVSGSGNPPSTLRMSVLELTGVNVVLSDSALLEDDSDHGPDWTQDLGSLTVTDGGIIVSQAIIGNNPADDTVVSDANGATTVYNAGANKGGPARWVGYKGVTASGTEELSIDWDDPGSDTAAHGQSAISAFFACSGEASTCPDAAQWVIDEFVAEGDGTTVTFTTRCPYATGSLRVRVDGHPIIAGLDESDPAAGEFTLDFAPLAAQGDAAAEQIYVDYQGRGSVP